MRILQQLGLRGVFSRVLLASMSDSRTFQGLFQKFKNPTQNVEINLVIVTELLCDAIGTGLLRHNSPHKQSVNHPSLLHVHQVYS